MGHNGIGLDDNTQELYRGKIRRIVFIMHHLIDYYWSYEVFALTNTARGRGKVNSFQGN